MTTEYYPPRLDELMSRFLTCRQIDSCLTAYGSEVETYDAVPAQAIDPRQAWDGALEAVQQFTDTKKLGQIPTGWATLVGGIESMTGLPMAAGNFPQLVRDWLPLVHATSLNETLKSKSPGQDVAGLSSWIESTAHSGDPIKWLLAAGLLRLTKRFDGAENLLKSKSPTKELKSAFANEEAAIQWQRGNHAAARKQWAKQPDSAAVQFNRGMADLFCENAKSAEVNLKGAVARLPESSGWHHLGLLYLALAQSR